MMFRRADNGGIDTKLIQNAPGPREAIWNRRKANGEEIGRDEDLTDTLDPRTRPWYSGALATSGISGPTPMCSPPKNRGSPVRHVTKAPKAAIPRRGDPG